MVDPGGRGERERGEGEGREGRGERGERERGERGDAGHSTQRDRWVEESNHGGVCKCTVPPTQLVPA